MIRFIAAGTKADMDPKAATLAEHGVAFYLDNVDAADAKRIIDSLVAIPYCPGHLSETHCPTCGPRAAAGLPVLSSEED